MEPIAVGAHTYVRCSFCDPNLCTAGITSAFSHQQFYTVETGLGVPYHTTKQSVLESGRSQVDIQYWMFTSDYISPGKVDLPYTPCAPYLIMNNKIVEAIPFLCWNATDDGIFSSPFGRDGRPRSYWHQKTVVGCFFVDPVRGRGCLFPVLNIRDEVLHMMSDSFNT